MESIDASKLIPRALTGIAGFDEITGGLPRARVTTVLGGPGSGKTIFGLEVIARGARDFAEPGLVVTFEERAEDLIVHSQLFGWDLTALRGRGVEFLDAQLAQSIVEGGDFDLLGLLAILGARAKETGARRVMFDGVDVLLAHLGDPRAVRREILRIREWVRESGLTAILTAKGDAVEALPSADYEFLQYAADCVVSLHHRVADGTALRTLRVVKYRGCAHSSNELPLIISHTGLELAGVTSLALDHAASTERVSTGVERLDTMLGGGYFRGSSVLVSGAPGTSKTSLAVAFADAACQRGERTLYVSFDEAPEQIVRNMASIGFRLERHVASGLLRFASMRALSLNPDAHVVQIRTLLMKHGALNLVVDPLSALSHVGGEAAGERAAITLLDFAKSRGVTVFNTSQLANGLPLTEETPLAVSTIADTWMHVSYVIQAGERNRALTIVKSRGTEHSKQVRELVLSPSGVGLADVYTVGGEVLMGTLRWEKESEALRAQAAASRDVALREVGAELAVAAARARASVLAQELAAREAALERVRAERRAEAERLGVAGESMRVHRGADATPGDEVAR